MNWLDIAIEMQAIAQAGLTYGKDIYDKERYQRLRELSAEVMASYTQLPLEKVNDLFCGDEGYPTPKMDTRAAIFEGDKILLVQENTGLWALPGGWLDVGQTIRSNAEKEAWEEAGLRVKAGKLIALQEQNLHNHPRNAHSIVKAFVLCEKLDGGFRPNSETISSGYFAKDELPPLSTQKTTAEQIALCFAARADENWQIVYD